MTSPYQLLPPLADTELAELAADISENGVIVPVLVDEEGVVIDGHHRQQIADDLGIDYPVQVVAGLTEAEKRDRALSLNLHRRHLNREQKREVIAASLTADPGLSNRQHAERTGVSDKTVASVRERLEATAEIPQSDERVSADGRVRPATQPPRPEPVEERVDELAPGELAAIEDTIAEAGMDTTDPEVVGQAIADAIESRTAPSFPTKPDLGGGISHPARYTDALLPQFAAILDELGNISTVLDPFAGTGKIHQLAEDGYETHGVEIEPEWATLDPRTVVGSALYLPFDEHSFDAIVTSPTYGNRLADSHNAADPERRRSYTHDLGRTLHPDNSGAMQWGKRYREFHEAAWNEAYRVLRPGGAFLLNIKDHIRDGKRQEVPAWHLTYLLGLGFRYRWHVDVNAPGLRAGSNASARYSAETIYVMERGE